VMRHAACACRASTVHSPASCTARKRGGSLPNSSGAGRVRLPVSTQPRCIYHLHHKPLYAAIGEPDSRLRRPMSAARVVENPLRDR
jgi:hypothetical protein